MMNQIDQFFMQAFEQAADAFSTLVHRDMQIGRSQISLMTGETFINRFAEGMDRSYFASIIRMEEAEDVHVIFMIPEEEGVRLYNSVAGESVSDLAFGTEDLVAGIGELNNIMGCTFLNVMANRLETVIHGSVPVSTYDMLGAILQGIVMQESLLDRMLLCAEATIQEPDREGYQVRLLIISEQDSIERILSASEEIHG